MIAPELMGHVAIPFKRKEPPFHRGCSSDVTSILRSGLTPGRRENKEGQQNRLHTSQPVRGQSRRRRTLPRLIEPEKSTRSQHVRGALLTKESDSSFAEAHRGFLSEPIHIQDEVKDQEDEVEDERDWRL